MWSNFNNCCYTLTIGAIVILSNFEQSFQYANITLEDSKLCSPITKRNIKLYPGIHSAMILTQKRLSEHPFDWTKNFACKFKIASAYHKGGVIAIIQKLKFRKNVHTGQCLDFVQFYNDKDERSRHFCGHIDSNKEMEPEATFSVNPRSSWNSFIVEDGDMSVLINVSRKALDTDERMDLLIVFTSFRDCKTKPDPESEDISVKPCIRNQNSICIDKQYFKDGYINCPFIGCPDELSCSRMKNGPVLPMGNKVLIGSVSTLVLMFALFVLCLWAFRKHRMLCWSQEFAHPMPVPESNRNSRIVEMNDQTGARLANPPTITSAPVDEDKDLPPSYESLFPESNNPVTGVNTESAIPSAESTSRIEPVTATVAVVTQGS